MAVGAVLLGVLMAGLGRVTLAGAAVALAAVLGGITAGEAADHLLRRGMSLPWRVEAIGWILVGFAVSALSIAVIGAVFFGVVDV